MEANPDPVTEFIRAKLRERAKDDPRGTIQAIEKASGLGNGVVVRIKNDARARVTSKTAQALAHVFGFDDYGAFLHAVIDWWDKTGRDLVGAYELPVNVEDPELRIAIEMVKGSGGVAREVILKTIDEEKSKIGQGKDRWWWTARIGENAHEWQKQERERVVDKKERTKATRDLSRARKEAPESSRSLAGEAPTVPPAPADSEPQLARPAASASVRRRRARS